MYPGIDRRLEVIPVSRVQRLAEKMPYITSLKLISEDGKVDFSYGKSDVSASELASAFVDYEVKVRSFDNEICFGSRIEESSSSDDSYLLIGCEPKSDFAGIFDAVCRCRTLCAADI